MYEHCKIIDKDCPQCFAAYIEFDNPDSGYDFHCNKKTDENRIEKMTACPKEKKKKK